MTRRSLLLATTAMLLPNRDANAVGGDSNMTSDSVPDNKSASPSSIALLPLPDPLILNDNRTRVTTWKQWTSKRRQEIIDLFADNVYGRTLAGRPPGLKFVVRKTKQDARDGRATRLRVGILFEGTETGRQMELLVYLPNHITSPVPVFLGLNFDGNFSTTTETDLPVPRHFVNGLFYSLPDHMARESQRGNNARMWPYDTILARGYGIATACYGEVEPDMPGQWEKGPRALGPPPTGPQDWGAIGGWAWALSRALDYLQTDPRIDGQKVAVFGFSRLGKTAMWAGAQDERFAAVVSQNSGKGGVSLYKHLVGESIAHLAGPDLGHWFAPKYKQYSNDEAGIPVDGHELAALIAPRPLLILSGTTDAYSDPQGEFLSGVHATPVYRLMGTDGLTVAEQPAPSTLIDATIGYYLRPGGHDVTLEDWAATIDWADKHIASRLRHS